MEAGAVENSHPDLLAGDRKSAETGRSFLKPSDIPVTHVLQQGHPKNAGYDNSLMLIHTDDCSLAPPTNLCMQLLAQPLDGIVTNTSI